MNLLREDRVYYARELLPALLRAGQFAHVSERQFLNALDDIYLDGSWGSNFGRKGYFGDRDGNISQYALIRAFRSKKCKEKLFDPFFATETICEKFGCICAVCGEIGPLSDTINALQYSVCPSSLFISDMHNRLKHSVGGSICSQCCRLIVNRALKQFSIKDVWENELVPASVWVEILSRIHKTPGTMKRMQENAGIWETLRFDPRRASP